MAKKVSIPVNQLSPKQLMQLTYTTTVKTYELLKELIYAMTDLDQAVSDLQAAVDGVAQRLLPHIKELEDALAAAQADDASVNDAVAAIRSEVDALNALGTDPSTPVDTEAEPVDPPEVEVPADPDAGGTTDGSTDTSSPNTSDEGAHPDNTLPGDLPADEEAAPAEGDTATTDEGPPRDPETGQFTSSE